MKKLLLVIFALGLIASCTPERLQDELQLTDKTKVCPPGDPDCNPN